MREHKHRLYMMDDVPEYAEISKNGWRPRVNYVSTGIGV